MLRSRNMAMNINENNPSRGFGSSIPKPNIITPTPGPNKDLEKFLMMYTCKPCGNRNSQMVSKVAYQKGMVISRCKQCQKLHLIADNEGKLDFPKVFGKRIDEYLESQGERVQRLSVTKEDLEDNFLVEQDGELLLIPKAGGQPSTDSTIIDYTYPIKPST